MAIRNAGESAEMKVITLNILSVKLKGKCLEFPHYAQPRPLAASNANLLTLNIKF